MIDRGMHNLLGVRLNAVDYDAATEQIVRAAKLGQPLGVSALAVHGLMTGALDETQRHRLNQIDLLVPDGQPVRWALNRLHGCQLADRVYGPNLMLEVCRQAAADGLPIFLFGCDGETLAELSANLKHQFPMLQIAGARPSMFRTLELCERSSLIEEVQRSGAKIAFVGIGCPRQEVFVYELRDKLRMPLIAVGAAFAFHAGRVPQAPAWMQRRGLEWLYRLLSEPRRLWRRYLYLNPLFLLLLAAQWTGLWVIDPENTRIPQQELCYG
jgi:exopolysaccharide biosynthesis WecB/TagA/CpsF family protein